MILISFLHTPAAPLSPPPATPGRPAASVVPRPAAAPSSAVLALAVAVAAIANFNVIWNHFYADVPKLFDTGWYADLVHRSSPVLQNPPTVAFATIGPDFYATHFSPFLWLLALPTYLLPVSPPVWLACVEALKHALIAMIGGLALRGLAPDGPPAPGQRRAAGVAAFLLPFNGVLLAGMAYSHFETWFVPFALGFLWLLFRGQRGPAAGCFAATLLVREDAGFHLCGVLAVSVVARLLIQRRWDHRLTEWLAFAAAGFAASAAALLLVKRFFPGDDAFARIYLGDPAFAHLTREELARRLEILFAYRGYIWLPAVVYAAWAATARAAWPLLGYLAFVPWFLLNLTAHSLAPGTLSLYYAFPFALALLWPCAAAAVFASARERARAPGWIAAALFASILGYIPGNDLPSLLRHLAPPRLEARAAIDPVVRELAAARALGVGVAIDDAVAAHAPRGFTARNLLGQSPPGAALTAFYANGRQAKEAWEASLRLPYHYQVQDTTLTVVSAAPLPWPSLVSTGSERGSIHAFLRGADAELGWDRPRDGGDATRTVLQGPKGWYLPPDEPWIARFELTVEPAVGGAVICEVLADGAVIAAALTPVSTSLPLGIDHTLVFTVPGPAWADVAVRVRTRGDFAGRVEEIALRPADAGPGPGSSSARLVQEEAP